MKMADWQVLLAWLGVATSAFFAWRSHKSSQRYNELQERLVALEEQREDDRVADRTAVAWIPVKVPPKVKKDKEGLMVRDDGPGTAYKVSLLLNGLEPQKFPGTSGSKFRRDRVRKGEAMSFYFSTRGYALTQVTVQWQDEQGNAEAIDLDVHFW